MFTGIIEALGKVKAITQEGANYHFDIEAAMANELKIDQSLAHNGACLTVVAQDDKVYRVTAIKETLDKTNLGSWEVGSIINLERCLKVADRLDGHMVQGHVDCVGECIKRESEDGSWRFWFKHPAKENFVTVPKGSITINGVSLTVVDSEPGMLSVAIIPYTYEHTNFHLIEVGHKVNLEFDILGKYVARLLQNR